MPCRNELMYRSREDRISLAPKLCSAASQEISYVALNNRGELPAVYQLHGGGARGGPGPHHVRPAKRAKKAYLYDGV
eukprot:4532214-Prymnesium_polylepis.1